MGATGRAGPRDPAPGSMKADPCGPAGHVGWAFSGMAEFEGRATVFLAEGHARHERLMVVADQPRTDLWPQWLLHRGDLVVASTAEVYGPGPAVDPAAVRRAFEAALGEALDHGYSGIRIAADNTSMITGPAALAAWLAWEEEVEQFTGANPVTGLCAFDRSRAVPGDLEAVMASHRVAAAPDGAAPDGLAHNGHNGHNGHGA